MRAHLTEQRLVIEPILSWYLFFDWLNQLHKAGNQVLAYLLHINSRQSSYTLIFP